MSFERTIKPCVSVADRLGATLSPNYTKNGQGQLQTAADAKDAEQLWLNMQEIIDNSLRLQKLLFLFHSECCV